MSRRKTQAKIDGDKQTRLNTCVATSTFIFGTLSQLYAPPQIQRSARACCSLMVACGPILYPIHVFRQRAHEQCAGVDGAAGEVGQLAPAVGQAAGVEGPVQ